MEKDKTITQCILVDSQGRMLTYYESLMDSKFVRCGRDTVVYAIDGRIDNLSEIVLRIGIFDEVERHALEESFNVTFRRLSVLDLVSDECKVVVENGSVYEVERRSTSADDMYVLDGRNVNDKTSIASWTRDGHYYKKGVDDIYKRDIVGVLYG